MIPPPPGRTAAPEREAGARPAPPLQPPAPAGTTENKRVRANALGRHTDRARKRYGRHALHDQSGASDICFVACPGKEEGQNEAGRPPAPPAPPAAQSGGKAHRPPPPHPPHRSAQERPGRADPPHGERTAPSQVGGKRERTAPPQARQTEHGTGAGHAEGQGPRGMALPAPSTGTARGVRATPTGGGGGGSGRRGSASAHTHKGHAGNTRRATRPTPGRHRPHGMAYHRARVRDTRTGQPATNSAEHAGREGGNEEDTTSGTGQSPPSWPRTPRTHDQGTAPAKAVVAHCATPQPQG